MTLSPEALQQTARDHLWGHFSRLTPGADGVSVIERGEGCYVWDSTGKRYLDGLSGLFTVQVGHGRAELAAAAGTQAAELAYFPLWTYAHPTAIELAGRLAALAPGDLNRVFFTTGGGEAVESAWKLARQYFAAIGQPQRRKVISRDLAYHGTTMGALSITGLAADPGAVRAAGAGHVPRPEHQPLPVPLLRGRPAVHAGLRRRDRGRHPARGARDGGRGLSRAGTELGWLLHARPTATSPGCARSATATACCSCPTR